MRFLFRGGFCFLAAAIVLPAAGQLTRVPNTTLTNVPPQPPVFGYTVNNAFPGLSITQPVCLAAPPGETNRLFILNKLGFMVAITNLAAPTKTFTLSVPVMSDSESGLIGLTFHPGFATNGYFYIFSSRSNGVNNRVQCISRFQMTSTNNNIALTNSEQVLIAQIDRAGNHNGGDLHFGPDGYLYASVGDEGAQYNGDFNAQSITNFFFSAILRIDVDKRPGNLLPNPSPYNSTNYFIPADNPFIGVTNFNGHTFAATNVRTEFFSVGYRNPWRFNFDPVTDIIYVGDVGQDLFEEIDIITNGANCGWPFYEGLHVATNLYPTQPGIYFTNVPPNLVFPIQEYPHSGTSTLIGNSVIGGIVYRGNRLSQLYGDYVFTDNGSGNVWMLRYNVTNTVPYQQIAVASGPSSLYADPRNGDVLIAQINSSSIGRLDYNSTSNGAPLPPTLSDTGVFSNVSNLTVNAGIVPYDINVPFWSDNAIKTRWFSLPNTNLAFGFNADGNWSFPTGTVWIKHFELELTNGVASSRQRLETRLLVKNDNGIYGVTYRWGSSLTNATLVPEEGLDESFVIHDGLTTHTQVWHYPSRNECSLCHTPAAGFALGFNTAQLNKSFDYGTGPTNQLATLANAHYFSNAIPNIQTLRALAPATNTDVSLEYRVRSYLAANCAQCHQPGGTPEAQWDARITTATADAGLVNGTLVNNLGNGSAHVLTPGSVANSVMLTRLANLDALHMPPLDTTVVNTQAVALISAWVTNDLPNFKTFADWQVQYFGSTSLPNAQTNADPDLDGNNNLLEYLTGTVPTNGADAWKLSIARSNALAQVKYLQVANRGFEVQYTTNLVAPVSWQVLNVPANAPNFAAISHTNVVPDSITNSMRYYRARVFAP